MTTLRKLPFCCVKLDGSLVAAIGRDETVERMLEAVLQLGAGLDIDVIGEEIESPEQLDWLRARNCRLGQGNILAPAVSLADFVEGDGSG